MNGQSDGREPIRVFAVIDVRLYREGLSATLGASDGIVVVGSATNRSDVRSTVGALRPDVVIVDVATEQGLVLIRDLQPYGPVVRVLAFAVNEDTSAIVDCAEAGACGYVTADASIDDLVDAIYRTAAGEVLCSPRVAAELFRRVASRAPRKDAVAPPAPSLVTMREAQVLGYLKQGLSNKEIANALRISEATVKNHVHRLLEKLHVSSRARAAASLADSLPGASVPLDPSVQPRPRGC